MSFSTWYAHLQGLSRLAIFDYQDGTVNQNVKEIPQ